jgi:hypothetical protein
LNFWGLFRSQPSPLPSRSEVSFGGLDPPLFLPRPRHLEIMIPANVGWHLSSFFLAEPLQNVLLERICKEEGALQGLGSLCSSIDTNPSSVSTMFTVFSINIPSHPKPYPLVHLHGQCMQGAYHRVCPAALARGRPHHVRTAASTGHSCTYGYPLPLG